MATSKSKGKQVSATAQAPPPRPKTNKDDKWFGVAFSFVPDPRPDLEKKGIKPTVKEYKKGTFYVCPFLEHLCEVEKKKFIYPTMPPADAVEVEDEDADEDDEE